MVPSLTVMTSPARKRVAEPPVVAITLPVVSGEPLLPLTVASDDAAEASAEFATDCIELTRLCSAAMPLVAA